MSNKNCYKLCIIHTFFTKIKKSSLQILYHCFFQLSDDKNICEVLSILLLKYFYGDTCNGISRECLFLLHITLLIYRWCYKIFNEIIPLHCQL